MSRVAHPAPRAHRFAFTARAVPTPSALLAEHSRELLGPRPMRRSVRIMVTMPSEAAGDYTLSEVGIVLKVETRAAFENLPRLLLAALRSRPVGVMVARGDLGVEVGFERLSEVQEEILWLCEAAHVPVIWATQVLEDMAKTGSPTRAEVSDAATSGGADCVMLNKGPHIVAAVEFLGGVLERMGAHQSKKTARLRKLSISENLPRGTDGPPRTES